MREYAERVTDINQSNLTAELHGSLNMAIELASRVEAFRASMLGAAPTQLEPKGGIVGPIRPVVDDLREHAQRTNRLIQDAMEALAAVERELN